MRTIRRHSMLTGVRTVLVALSGGPDSVALLLVLLELRRLLGIEVTAGHVNHGLRGRDSDGDEEFADRLCRRLAVPFTSRRLEVPGSVEGNLEQRLRRLRYSALHEMTPSGGGAATGHTLDDQVETFFLKAARGAGPTGLAGIFPVRRGVPGLQGKRLPLRVIRPLIESPRREVLAYLGERGQDYRSDPTNENLGLDRNWVRLELLPKLRERLNPKILENVGRSTELLREIQVYLGRRAKAALARAVVSRREGGTRLRVPALRRLPTALLHETLRLALRRTRGSLRGVGHVHILAISSLLEAQSGRTVDIGAGWKVWREFEELRFTAASDGDFAMELSIPGELFVQELGATLRTRRVEAGGGRPGAIRLRLAADSLLARNPRAGDRIRLARGLVKLKDLWSERKVPLSKRRRTLVLENDGELAWVEGIGVGTGFEPTPDASEWVEIDVAIETFGG